MSFFGKLLDAGKRFDRTVYRKTGLRRVAAAVKPKIPPGLRIIAARYGPIVALITTVAVFAFALTDTRTTRVTTSEEGGDSLGLGDEGGSKPESEDGSTSSGGEGATASGAGLPAGDPGVAGQAAIPQSANVCGNNGILATGPVVQYPHAVQCLPAFSGDNGGGTYRGVFRDKIRVAQYVTIDPQIKATTAAGGGCAIDQQEDCWIDYAKAYSEWFSKYYLTYGRTIELVPIRGTGREGNVETAITDARRIADIDPPLFAVLGGPGEAGAAYAEELKANGIVCFCTVSLPQEFYEKNAPFVWNTLMSSTQAYIHRSEYVGKRLAGRKAEFAGEPALGQPDLRTQNRSFGLVWFDNTRGDYKTGVDFFEQQLAQYNVKLAKKVRYENIEGCQKDAPIIIQQLQGVSSVVFSGDPICPISLTEQAQAQGASWEWIITGSVLTDSNNLARLYERNQWSRAFGVSMLSPDVKNANDAWYKMYKEVRPDTEPKEDAQLFISPATMLYTGIHLAGAALNPESFQAGMASAIPRGGTPTVPAQSWGEKKIGSFSFWDYLRFDDMTEIWWDNSAEDPNGNARAYRYVNGAQRHAWGAWPSTDVTAFNEAGTVTGYDKPPDQ